MLNHVTDISIDGNTAIAFTENVEQRFLSYGWHVLHVDDGDKYASPFYNQFAWDSSLNNNHSVISRGFSTLSAKPGM